MKTNNEIACHMTPWSSEDAFEEANQSIRRMIRQHADKSAPLVDCVSKITVQLAILFSIFEDLCMETCSYCPEPCCQHAWVWYDFNDLLFLNLAGLPVPSFQPRSGQRATCGYLGNRGCSLKRLQRPWICHWYVCPTQMTRLRNRAPDVLKQLNDAIQEIKSAREQMEAVFLNTVS